MVRWVRVGAVTILVAGSRAVRVVIGGVGVGVVVVDVGRGGGGGFQPVLRWEEARVRVGVAVAVLRGAGVVERVLDEGSVQAVRVPSSRVGGLTCAVNEFVR